MWDDWCWMTGVSYVTPRNEESHAEELKNAEQLKNVLLQREQNSQRFKEKIYSDKFVPLFFLSNFEIRKSTGAQKAPFL